MGPGPPVSPRGTEQHIPYINLNPTKCCFRGKISSPTFKCIDVHPVPRTDISRALLSLPNLDCVNVYDLKTLLWTLLERKLLASSIYHRGAELSMKQRSLNRSLPSNVMGRNGSESLIGNNLASFQNCIYGEWLENTLNTHLHANTRTCTSLGKPRDGGNNTILLLGQPNPGFGVCQCSLGSTSEMRSCALQGRDRLRVVPEGCAERWSAAGTHGNTKEWRSKGCKVLLSTGKLMQQEGKQLCFCHTWSLEWIPLVCPNTQTCACIHLELCPESYKNKCVWTQVRYLHKTNLFPKMWEGGLGWRHRLAQSATLSQLMFQVGRDGEKANSLLTYIIPHKSICPYPSATSSH